MTDLTLDEFRGIPEGELKKILREEARKISGSDSYQNNVEEALSGSDFFSFALRYWTRLITFLSSMHIPLKDRL